MPKKWNDLDGYERERVAARLVAAIYYPPQLSDTKKQGAKKTEKKNKKRRRLTLRSLLAHEFGARIDALMLTITQDDRSFESFKGAFLLWAKLWQPGWLNRLQEAPRLQYVDRIVPRERWEGMCNLYLVALAKIRLRHAGRHDTARRSVSLVIVTRKGGKKESSIEDLIITYKTVWPMICAAMQLLGEARGSMPSQPGASIHELVASTPPTSRELIQIATGDPDRYFAACRYFLGELSAESGLKQQHQPPMTPDQCFKWPTFADLNSVFVPSEVMRVMSAEEESLTASRYYYTDYKRGGVGHG
jgi:hypothetical protein